MYGAEFIEVLNFSNEDVEGNVVGCNREEGHDFQVICSAGQDAFNTSCSASSADSDLQSTPDDFMVELPIPCEEIAHLEWLSAFVANSEEKISLDDDLNNNVKNNSSSNDDDDENNNIKSSHFRSSSPISVLESSSCSGKHMLLGSDTFVPGRARSKRPRPTSFLPRPITFISPASLETTDPAPQLPMSSSVSFESDNFTESPMPKKKKKKLHHHVDRATSQPVAVRKCMHCEIQKTPQWRAGPMGPKTLCNACGVRYKSGRLFPEYRPAASPTFVAAKHSNSHKKVVEMRIVSGETAPAPKPEFVRKIAHCLNTLEK